MSVEDIRALQNMNDTVAMRDGKYMCSLPWKEDPLCLPNNRSLAEARLKLLRRKLERNPIWCLQNHS